MVRETKHSTIEKECLGVKQGSLLPCSFTIHCMKDANAQIIRWYLALQPYKFMVFHRTGTHMVVVDYLSHHG